ncbi:hypothetical protein DFR71_3207 [Nocardia alba]|uniref:Uncharacterized protein n=1 Tax=Nocardia alba TaxID=225051 RepID=A0A4R1G0K8_9NOCA|nr:hypothetical protein DFR71_3207 [Nocardia alba]
MCSNGRLLISDLDLLHVHTDAEPVEKLRTMAERCFVTVDVMVLPVR